MSYHLPNVTFFVAMLLSNTLTSEHEIACLTFCTLFDEQIMFYFIQTSMIRNNWNSLNQYIKINLDSNQDGGEVIRKY